MEEIKTTPLGQFRKKAVNITLIFTCITVILIIAAAVFLVNAQHNLYLSSLYSSIEDKYLAEYNSDNANAVLCLLGAMLTFSVALASAFAWIGTNLLIANKCTVLAAQKSIDVPMELGVCENAVSAPIGSEIVFKESGSTLLAITLKGETVGTLNGEFIQRIKKADKNATARAFITTYHGDHPVIEINANAR